MMRKVTVLISAVALVALVVAAGAPGAQAACSAAQELATGLFPAYFYSTTPSGASTEVGGGGLGLQRVGHFWEPGKRASQASGTYTGQNTADPWWRSFDNGALYGWYIRGNLQNVSLGCPGVPSTNDPGADATGPNELIVVLLDKATDNSESYYYVARPTFDGTGTTTAGRQFEMGPASPPACSPKWTQPNLVPIPKPFVTSSARLNATTVTLDLNLADVAPAFQGKDLACVSKSPHASITGYNLCTQERSNVSPAPTRDASDGWVCASAGAATGGGLAIAGRQETCSSAGNARYLATQLVIDGGPPNGYVVETVSKAVRIECNPNIANPIVIEHRRPQRPGSAIEQTRPTTKGR